jgi:pimeloyl-ACP methyl ester carboxylesterase
MMLITAAAALAWFQQEYDVDIRTIAENATVVSHDGTVIAFSKLGHGPPLILVDGAFCFRDNGPTPQLASLLAQRFTVYVYDRRGRGESGDTTPYAIEREVEDLGALLDAAGGSAFVFGMSSGAGIVLRAVQTGLRVKRIALYEPPFITDKNGQPRHLGRQRAALERLVAAGNRSEAVTYVMTEVFGAPRVFIHVMRIVMRTVWKKNESVAHTLPRDLAILDDWSVLKAGASITIPALIIGGAKSPVELQVAVKTVGESVPNSQRRMLEGQSHNVSMKVLAPALEEFYFAK